MFSTFSGYIAVDELYDGDTTLLSLVDNRNHRRIMFEILDHTPKQADIITFFKRFKREMENRGCRLLGVTTDGSPLYPEAIRQVFGPVPHQICVFHVLKEINKAILKAVAQVRRDLGKELPKMPRGRPKGKEGRQAARKKSRLEHKIADIFKYRHVIVARHLSAEDQKNLARISRGLPILRTLRTIADDVYRLFDRRCLMTTAQKKLGKLRKHLYSVNV
ncbi:MAG: transposase [Candidatus Riflebacteria bacterium]|nr:transposase [Candidatus Riflebacteria bacterium]